MHSPTALVIREHLLDEFGKHATDPWWWPIDPAIELKHWGLRRDDQDVLTKFSSLRPEPPSRAFPGFLGSLGAAHECIFVLGERPSFGKDYGRYVRPLENRLSLLRGLPQLSDFLGKDPEFHITDLIKFRGGNFRDRLSDQMIEISLRCLSAEFDLLRPKITILTNMAEKQLPGYRRRSKLQAAFDSKKFQWLFHSNKATDAPIVIDVPHWSRPIPEDEWRRCVRAAIATAKR